MGIKCGIVGLPNVGKSTLFNALTNAQNAAAENYPFCTIDPNTGIVPVPVNFKFPAATIADVIADCGAGFTAVGGGADCTKGSRLMASCPCASTMCTACADGALPARYWLGVCSSANVQNKAFAFCVRN